MLKLRRKRRILQKCPSCGSAAYRVGYDEKGNIRYRCTHAECSMRNFDERDLKS